MVKFSDELIRRSFVGSRLAFTRGRDDIFRRHTLVHFIPPHLATRACQRLPIASAFQLQPEVFSCGRTIPRSSNRRQAPVTTPLMPTFFATRHIFRRHTYIYANHIYKPPCQSQIRSFPSQMTTPADPPTQNRQDTIAPVHPTARA